MNHTKNFNLRLPERSEQFNLDDWNNNTTSIDSAMQANKTNISNNATNITSILNGLSTVNTNNTSSIYYKLMKLIYPVGSLYWSSKSTNPASLFGGTWVQIKDRFVLACGDTYKTVGATGGALTATLSVSNMPSHNHSFTPSGTVSSHYHGLNGHSHSFTPSGSITRDGQHYHYIDFRDDNLSWSSTQSNSHVNAYHTSDYVYENYNYPESFQKNGAIVYYPSVYSLDTGISATFDSASIRSIRATNQYLTNGIQSPTSWSGYHSHRFTGSAGTTNGTSGNSESATPTFTGRGGTTGSNGSGTAFSILPPYVVKYCWERTA